MKIAVLCGGLSHERDVSISSGTGIALALRERGYSVALVDLFLGVTEWNGVEALFTEKGGQQIFVAEKAPELAAVRAMRPGQGLIGPHVLEICQAADMVLLALHGEEGENGKIQALLDIYGIRYTGSGYLGSALAMNKSLTKELLRQAGIPVPPGITVRKGQTPHDNPGFPCVVKPCSGGSSVGTTIVRSPEEYEAALELVFRYEDSVLAEEFVSGRELTVGILDGRAMPVIEIIPKSGFYDYKNKYLPGMTEELCPAPLTTAETERVQTLGEQVYAALGLEVYGRVDLIMDKAGVCYCLEANTLPGMTPTSLIPQMGVAMGMDFGQLCQRLIEISQKKYQ
ncbi:MAG: D-alanine--D-alanine ligase [Clostridiales bacterium]|nr:D-alanine--D-alanine ligase [Clostridiales bacterium]MCD8117230.1 D-alanine--D-alanine ligase [Oscillospiraceae bacterium]